MKAVQRAIAGFLLLFGLAGVFVPVAQAVTAAPPHACCVRKTHHCHGGAESDQPAAQAASCCGHDCCRAVTTPRWAAAGTSAASAPAGLDQGAVPVARDERAATIFFLSRSTRAPPLSPLQMAIRCGAV